METKFPIAGKNEDKPSTDDKKEMGLNEKLLKTRTLTLFDEINAKSAKEITQALLLLEADDVTAPIKLLLNTPGGDVNAGFAIFDTIRFIKPEVKILCTGICASMGTIILLAADKKNRLSLPNCEFMLHQPHTHGITGRISDIEIATHAIVKTKNKMLDMLTKETGRSKSQIEKDCDRDFWLTAQEAQEYGLISKVIQNRLEIE